jgi:hypothetical protein
MGVVVFGWWFSERMVFRYGILGLMEFLLDFGGVGLCCSMED